MKPLKCPNCNYVFDSHSSASGESDVIQPGAISICFNCTAVLRFNEELSVDLLSEKELQELKKDKESWDFIVLVRDKIRQVQYARKLTNSSK
jgi:hypothetical protein